MATPIITGSWIDIMHLCPRDGVYWNRRTIAYSEKEWQTLVQHLHRDLGIEMLFLQNVAYAGVALYPSRVMDQRFPLGCEDPIGAIFRACSAEGVQLFPGIGAQHDIYAAGGIGSLTEESRTWHRRVSEEMLERYGEEPSFAGFYMCGEIGICDGFWRPEHLEFTAGLTEIWGELLPGKPRIASPWVRGGFEKTPQLVEAIRQTGLDIIAYQDGHGFSTRHQPDHCRNWGMFETLRWAHDQTEVELWANTELFRFENDIHFQPLLPGPFSRIRRQLQDAAPHVERIIAYTVPGIMTQQAICPELGVPETDQLYADYQAYHKELHAETTP